MSDLNRCEYRVDSEKDHQVGTCKGIQNANFSSFQPQQSPTKPQSRPPRLTHILENPKSGPPRRIPQIRFFKHNIRRLASQLERHRLEVALGRGFGDFAAGDGGAGEGDLSGGEWGQLGLGKGEVRERRMEREEVGWEGHTLSISM